MAQQTTYPVNLRGDLSQPPGRGWWLLKWLLAIPHYIVLAFLGIAYWVLTVIAFFAILFTARYPRGLFTFNVGVLRWGWRVGFYAFSLGTDRYPPFSLEPMADYPADLDIVYPEKLSRGLVLVKWWLLAIPHYIVVAFFMGGSLAWQSGDWTYSIPGLISVLAIFAGVALLFTAKYPEDIFRLVVGMSRWNIRVAAYAALMTDEYPPFRLWD